MVYVEIPQENGHYFFENLIRDINGIVFVRTDAAGTVWVEGVAGGAQFDEWQAIEDFMHGDRFYGPIDLTKIINNYLQIKR